MGDLPGQPRARQALTARPIPVAATSSPTCLPLGPLNTLVIAPGIVSGTAAPTPGRTSFEAKSPLTGGIKEANAGGLSWQQIASLGIKAIVVEGQPTVTDACYLLRVTKDGAEILPADDLAGMGMYEAYRVLWARHGNVAVVGVGPAGVCVNDKENTAGRYAGRGGLGAVMGGEGSQGHRDRRNRRARRMVE